MVAGCAVACLGRPRDRGGPRLPVPPGAGGAPVRYLDRHLPPRQRRFHEHRAAQGDRPGARRAGRQQQGGALMARKLDYRWHLRQVMASRGLFATTDLIEPLARRGIRLSSSQVYRLVVDRPEPLSLQIFMALVGILDCSMSELIEPVAAGGGGGTPKAARGAEAGGGERRPKRRRLTGG